MDKKPGKTREEIDHARTKILLKAAYEILQKCDKGAYVKNALEETAKYDGTDCDGYCLMTDIGDHLELD